MFCSVSISNPARTPCNDMDNGVFITRGCTWGCRMPDLSSPPTLPQVGADALQRPAMVALTARTNCLTAIDASLYAAVAAINCLLAEV